MKYESFTFCEQGFLILCTKQTFIPTESGKSWRNKPDTVKNTVVSADWYTKCIASIPFFNRFGYGAYCRGHWGNTFAGYLPVRVVTVNPGRTQKNVVTFEFVRKSPMIRAAGNREKWILDNAVSFEWAKTWEGLNRPNLLTLYTDDTGVCAYGSFDTTMEEWRG